MVTPRARTGRAKSGHETNRIDKGFVDVVDGANSVRPDHRDQGAELVAGKNRRRNTCRSLKSRAPGKRFKLGVGEGDLDRGHLAKFDAQAAVGFERGNEVLILGQAADGEIEQRRRLVDSPPGVSMPAAAELASEPILAASSSRTRRLSRANRQAMEAPMTPPPAMMTS